MKLFYYEIITSYASAGFFSGYLVETDFGLFDYWNEDDNTLFYSNMKSFIKDMEAKEGPENFIMIEV